MPKLRKLLRKIEPEALALVKDELHDGAEAIAQDMRGGAPVDSGDLRDSIAVKYARDGLSAYIGPGVDRATIIKKGFGAIATKTKKSGGLTSASIKNLDAQLQLYKAHWIEHGTKPHGNHPGQPARPFLNPAYDANSASIKAGLRQAIDQALKEASRV